jgi:hypothetical protein
LWLQKRFEDKFFSPHSFVDVFGSEIRDPGSAMCKNQDPGSEINIPDPQHCLREAGKMGWGGVKHVCQLTCYQASTCLVPYSLMQCFGSALGSMRIRNLRTSGISRYLCCFVASDLDPMDSQLIDLLDPDLHPLKEKKFITYLLLFNF